MSKNYLRTYLVWYDLTTDTGHLGYCEDDLPSQITWVVQNPSLNQTKLLPSDNTNML